MQMFVLFEIILIGIVAFVFISYISGFADSSVFDRAYIGNDLKMILETISTSPQIIVYDYVMNNTKTTHANNTNITVAQFYAELSTNDEIEVKQTFSYANSLLREFSGTEPGVNYTILASGNLMSLSRIQEQDIKRLACERYKREKTQKNGKKIIWFNENENNKRIVELLKQYFDAPLKKAQFGVAEENPDIYLHIDCADKPALIIDKARTGNQKLACLLAEQIQEIDYIHIEQKPDQNIAGKAGFAALHLIYDCNERSAAKTGAAIEDFFR
jgi:hypothetical protein